MPTLRLIIGILLAASCLSAQAAEHFLARLRSVGLDPQQCYRVRDLFLEREDVRFYFTDGLLIFAESVDGKEVGAFFVAEEPTDSAEILVIPPSPQERASLTSFTGEGVLSQPFIHAVLLFTDDTADVLRAGIAQSAKPNPDLEHGERLGRRWTPVFRNLLSAAGLRIATDHLSNSANAPGLFAAAIGGGVKGRFDVIIDPRGESDQVSIGQRVDLNDSPFHEVWTRFPSRSVRTGRTTPIAFGGKVRSYDIDVTLADDLSVAIIAGAEFVVDQPDRRTFPFSLAPRLDVTKILVDGQAVEFLHQAKDLSDIDPRDLSTALVLLPSAPEVGDVLDIEFHYRGQVVEHTDNDVYLVGSRTSWYPRGKFETSDHRLTFHYPASFDLRATGTLTDTSLDGDRKTSVFTTGRPINLAGFNLGRYQSAEREVDGYHLEILANRVPELYLPAPQAATTASTPEGAGSSDNATPPVAPLASDEATQPTNLIEEIADQVAQSFRYFLKQFGEPISKHIAVTPVPDGYGQGFPGLVYAPTLSYLDPLKSPLVDMRPAQRAFYKEVLIPHEISHQWWGNLVSVDNASDSWLVEALATYSALMYLEDSIGPDAIARFLQYYRASLLHTNAAGETVESAGPPVLGERLTSSRFPGAVGTIVYGKGAWVIHMLRVELGQEAFGNLLSNLTSEFSEERLTTDRFRQSAASYLPDSAADPELLDFFAQWVYGTGIPRLTADWSQAEGRIEGTISQKDVPDHFEIPLTLEIVTAAGSVRHQMRTDGELTAIRIDVAEPVLTVTLDPDGALLATIE